MLSKIAGYSWEEHYGPDQDRELARKIVGSLEERLRQKCKGAPSLFIAAPHPGLVEEVEARLSSLVTLSDSFYVITRTRRPNAYATEDRQVFEKLLPFFFRWGCPETTLLAVAGLDHGISRANFGDLITRMIQEPELVSPPYFALMYFDEGDLFVQR
jgi:hypothetical protein